jgi:hypothetical protein
MADQPTERVRQPVRDCSIPRAARPDGPPTDTLEIDPDGDYHFDGTVGPLPTGIANAVDTVRISAADSMVAVRPR